MSYTVSITTQGQISIPAPLRRKLGLHTSTKAIVSEEKGKMVVVPTKDLLELKGSLKTKHRVAPNKIRGAFEDYLGGKS